jgi:hypothetical protein
VKEGSVSRIRKDTPCLQKRHSLSIGRYGSDLRCLSWFTSVPVGEVSYNILIQTSTVSLNVLLI